MTLSELTVQGLIRRDPTISNHGFNFSCLKLICDEAEKMEWTSIFKKCRVIPDAFKICHSCKTITAFEVEDSNKLTEEKLSKYAMLWFYMDCEEADLLLCVMDRYGNNRNYINLEEYYWTFLMEDVGKKRRANFEE